jgi:4-amino-4-deoxy-L-arabinose transferase-like glycosyltransferase
VTPAQAGFPAAHPHPVDSSPGTILPGAWLSIALAGALFGVPLLANLPLIDPDEGLHAAIAAEMVARGDYTVPRLLGVAFLDKPILFFAAQALAVSVLGETELAVRLPGHVFGLLGAVSTGILGAVLAGRAAGFAAAFIYATLLFPLALNQAAVHDVALVPWTNLALACFAVAMRRPDHPVRVVGWCVLAGLWLGLAALTKGLVGVAICGVATALVALVERRMSTLLVLGGIVSLAVAAIVAAPWYLAVERIEPGYLNYFFVERHLLGFTTQTQIHAGRPWWYYGPILLGGSLPWVLTAVAAWQPHGGRGRAAGLRRFAALWLGAGLLLLSAAGSKLPTYLLPLYPAVALLAAVAWLTSPEWPQRPPGAGLGALVRLQAIAGALLLPAAAAWAVWMAGLAVSPGHRVGIGAASVAWLGLAWRAPRWPLERAFVASTGAMAATLIVAYLTIFPDVAGQRSARDLAVFFNARGEVPPRLLIVDERVGSLLFYLDGALREQLTPKQVEGVTLARALVQGAAVAGTLVAVPDAVVSRLEARLELGGVAFEEAGRYRLYAAADLRRARPRWPAPAGNAS